jgi:hypothetical protein
MSHTIFAAYRSLPDALELRAALEAAGVRPDDIRIASGSPAIGSGLLSGVPVDDLAFYRQSLERGHVVVRIETGAAVPEKVSQLLDSYGPITQREGVH